MAKAAKKRGRPATGPEFEEDVIEELLARTEKGEPLSRICEDKRMPKRRTVYDWQEKDEDFAARFRDARARGIHYLAEECIAIADKPAKDAVEVADKRVKIDTRLRLAGKWLPAAYGDKIDVTSGGEKLPVDDISRATRLAAIFAEIEKQNASD
jgi:hypothetical protein